MRELGGVRRSVGAKGFGRTCLLCNRRTCLGRRCGEGLIGTLGPSSSAVGFAECRKGKVSIQRLLDLYSAVPFFTRQEMILLRSAKFFGGGYRRLTSCVGTLPSCLCLIFYRSRMSGEDHVCGTMGTYNDVKRFGRRSRGALVQ